MVISELARIFAAPNFFHWLLSVLRPSLSPLPSPFPDPLDCLIPWPPSSPVSASSPGRSPRRYPALIAKLARTVHRDPFVHVNVFWRSDDRLKRSLDQCSLDERLTQVQRFRTSKGWSPRILRSGRWEWVEVIPTSRSILIRCLLQRRSFGRSQSATISY